MRVRGGGRRGGEKKHLEAVLRRGDVVGGGLERDLKAKDVSACRAFGRVHRRASWLLRGGLRGRGVLHKAALRINHHIKRLQTKCEPC